MKEVKLEKEIILRKWDKVCDMIGERLIIESNQYRFENSGRKVDILAYANSNPKIYYLFELKKGNITPRDIGQVQDYAHSLKKEKHLHDIQVKVVLVGKDKSPDKTLKVMLNHFPYENRYMSYKQILNEEDETMYSKFKTKQNLSIAITNTRGGVGKSTTAFILSCLLQEKGYKVLAIDLDPQGTLTYYALNGQDNTKIKQGISTILLEDTSEPASLVKNTDKGFDLIPANDSLKDDQYRLTSIPGKETLLREFVLSKTDIFPYDVVIVDVQGAIGTLFQIATISTDKALIVFEPDNTNENPIRNTLNYIRKSKTRVNQHTRNEELFLGALPSKHANINVHKDGLEHLTEKIFSKIPIKVYSPVHDRKHFKEIQEKFDLSPFKKEKGLLEPYEEIIADIEKQLK